MRFSRFFACLCGTPPVQQELDTCLQAQYCTKSVPPLLRELEQADVDKGKVAHHIVQMALTAAPCSVRGST
jgi:hypothetical protein